jgi:L-gulonolactone oxidase
MPVAVLPRIRIARTPIKPASAGRPTCEPAEIARVQCERDIVDAVCRARERLCEVRPVGGKGSKNDCYGTSGLCLDLSNYGAVLAFDGRTVTVQAGIKMGRLNEFLRHRGAIVPTCGEWQGATVSGSLATGSHGGSSRHGIYPTSVLSFRLVAADGRVLDIDRANPLFEHAGVSVGTLGVVSTVTLACEPAFHLEMETRVVPFREYLRDYAALNQASEFFAAVWFPTARSVLTFSAHRVDGCRHGGQRLARFGIRTFLFDCAKRYLDLDVVDDAYLARRWFDDGDRIICPLEDLSTKMRVLKTLSQDWRETELAIPQERAPEALERIERVLHDHDEAMLNALGVRSSPADAFSLSPCHGRDTFWIDVFFDEWHNTFVYDLADVAQEFDARCHWGKYISLDPAHLRAQYPRMNAFRDVRAALDPAGLFANDFTRRTGL